MAVRKCSTCKHYEPAPIWRKGWCRNPLLYSPQQSHLVGEDDLDCDRGMGNYWEPSDQGPGGIPGTANAGFGEGAGDSSRTYEERGNVAPLHLRGQHETDERTERRGGDVSQYGGPGRPTGSDDYGTGGAGQGGDDDRYTQPFSEQGGSDPYGGGGGERTPFGYQPEERYWTDYLRIAAPVVGVILMLGLVWFWVANMLGDDNNDEDVATEDSDTNGPVIPSETEEPTPEDEEVEGDGPIAVTTPDSEENGNSDGEGEGEENGEDSPTTIGPGATVIVIGTGQDGLNIRASASTEAEVVDSVADGTELTVTGEAQEAENFVWWPVEAGETTGFVVQEFIELSE
ncbi:MAG: SH3 domain-containing protein [Thermomicrobiaceae bacterium]